MKTFWSIKRKLIVFALCISLIPITIITVIYYLNARNTVKERILNDLAAIAESKKMHIQTFIESKKGRLIDFSSDGFIRDCTEEITMRENRHEYYSSTLNNHLIINKKSLDPGILEVFIVDFNGKVIASTDKNHIGNNVSGESYFTEVEFLSAFADTPHYDSRLEENVISFSTVLLSKVGREAIGIIVNRIKYEQQDSIGQDSASFQQSDEWNYSRLLAVNKARIIDFSSDGFIRDCTESITRREDKIHYYTDLLNTHLTINKQPLDSDIIAVFVVDLTGKIIGSSEFGLRSKDVSGEVYFTEAMKHGYSASSLHYSPVVKQGSFEMAKLLLTKDGQNVTGIIVNRYSGKGFREITLSGMSEELGQGVQLEGLGETGELYLVNRDKLMITDSRFMDDAPFRQVVDTEPVRKIVNDGEEMIGLYHDYRGVLVVGASVNIPEYGWILLAEIDKAEAFAPLRLAGVIAMVVGGICSAAAIFGGIVFSLSAARPISKLKDATDRFAKGDMDYRVNITNKDEVGNLARSFNNMADDLKMLTESLEKKISERTAKLSHANEELLNEITERKRVEDELKNLTKSLEKRVIMRTAKLRETNEQLRVEITEHKRAEEELYATNKELEAFCYSISHDLRAPLRSIDGFSKALVEDYADKLDSHGKDYVKRVRKASQRMGQLIKDLLSLSRITRSELHHEKVDLSIIAHKIATELEMREPDRQVEFIIPSGITVDGDAKLLLIAMENLLYNAWKFTGKQHHARIEFGAKQNENKTVYFVNDDGAGFDMAYADKLFGAFQRLHSPKEFEGDGIGLAIVQRIIHRHGGRIWAEGAVGQGAKFYFTI